MERCCLVAETILNIDYHRIAFGDSDDGRRPLIIDSNRWPYKCPIRVGEHPSNIEIISYGCCSCQVCKDGQEHCHKGEAWKRDGHREISGRYEVFLFVKDLYVDVGFRWGSGGTVFWIFNLDREREEEEMTQRTRCRGTAKTIAGMRLVSQ